MFAKKNLVAVAALLAVAGAAQAQSSVKLYGMIDAGLASLEDAHAKGDKARTTQVTSGAMMTSYIGFAGVEDLGGGLKAEFALESFLNADTGKTAPNMAGGFWGRGSWVGLSGGFGRVALGQYDNPLFTSGYTYNPFGSSMVVSPTMRHFYSSAASLGFDTGFVNSVTYESPVVSGFQGIAQYAAKESTASTAKNSYAVAGSYNAGPFSAMLTYVKGGNTSVAGASPSTTYTLSAYRADQKVWNLGTSYDFGVAKAFLQYTDVKTSAGVDVDTTVTPNQAAYFSGAKAKNKIWQLGVSVPVTDKAVVLASFGQNKYKDDPSAASEKDEVFSIGYDYNLSKRTDVYAAFINNRKSANTGLDSSGQSYAVGIRHNF